MLRSILVGLDGSAFSDSALSLAVEWAKTLGSRVVGQAVIDLPGIAGPEDLAAGSGFFKAMTADPRLVAARRKVDEFAARFRTRCHDAGVSGEVREEPGDPAEVILAEAQRHDLILLGSETYFRFATQDVACETLDKVLHSPPRPVVAVPAQHAAGKAVVVGYDGSLQAARTVAAFVATGLHTSRETVVVTIDEDYDEAARTAGRAIEYLALHGAAASARPVETRLDPASILLDHTVQLDAHLLVMGAFGHSALRDFFFGSTTRSVLKESKVPVMLYH